MTGDNELTLHFDDDEENGDDEKLNDDVPFSANHSYNNDSNNNLCDLTKLQIPTSSMDTLTQSNVSLNMSLNVPSVSPNSQNLASSPSSPQQHPSILLRTPELNVVQEGVEIMQFLPPNHPANYTITSQTNLPPNFRLSSIANNNPPASTVHHRTSRCKMALINNQADYCNCKNYRHSMFVGNGHLDYSNSGKPFAPGSHLHPDELYTDDYPIANTVDAGLNLASSTSMDAVNNQWLVSGKQHICPSCNCNHTSTNYKKSCVSLSEKHLYHLHQPSCHNLNQLSSYNSQENYLHQSNLKTKEFYLDSTSNPKLSEQPRERLTQILGEMIIPFIFAGLGNVATGYMLSNVQTWAVFKNVPQLIILIPALLGLKDRKSVV